MGKQAMIDLINYHSFGVAIQTKENKYWVECMEGDTPTRLPLTLDEIKYINMTSEAFKLGLLFFDKDIEKEIYENDLRITTWEDILKPEQIKDIIINPTTEGLNKLLKIKSVLGFDIVRGIFINLKNKDNYDISTRVERLIKERYKELSHKIYDTKLIVKPKDSPIKKDNKEIDTLKKELEEMKALLTNFLATQQTSAQNETQEEVKVEKKEEVKTTPKTVSKTTPKTTPKTTTKTKNEK